MNQLKDTLTQTPNNLKLVRVFASARTFASADARLNLINWPSSPRASLFLKYSIDGLWCRHSSHASDARSHSSTLPKNPPNISALSFFGSRQLSSKNALNTS